jgi:hypothetical protein
LIKERDKFFLFQGHVVSLRDSQTLEVPFVDDVLFRRFVERARWRQIEKLKMMTNEGGDVSSTKEILEGEESILVKQQVFYEREGLTGGPNMREDEPPCNAESTRWS